VSRLVELKALSLASNKLEGELSAAVGSCVNLRLLDVSNNQLTVSDVRPHMTPCHSS
jgi:Leucine-rich repeat (LRR) protein